MCLCEWEINYDITLHPNKSFQKYGVPKLCLALSLNIEGVDLVTRTYVCVKVAAHKLCTTS